MHKLLNRQLKRFFSKTQTQPPPDEFLEAVDQAYKQTDQERELLERSLDLTSKELSARNHKLRAQLKELKTTHGQLQHSIATLNATFNSTGEAIFVVDGDSKSVQMNHMASTMLKIPDEKLNHSLVHCLKCLLRQVSETLDLKQYLRMANKDSLRDLFGFLNFRDGQLYEFHSSAQTNKNEVIGRVWCVRNVTETKKNEATIHHQAFHDSLTQLPNRILLIDRLEHFIFEAQRENKQIGILFIDLDHFKKVNDTAGHHVGDLLLIEVANRIRSCLREPDTLARLGGDEFVVLIKDLTSFRTTTNLSNRIIEYLKKPFLIEQKEFFISSSIGISIYPRDGVNHHELIRKADMSMYHAKETGRSNFQYFNTALERLAMHQISVENKLRYALAHDEFNLHFQPKVSPYSGKIDSLEALLRWSPDNKPVAPIEFIQVAEQVGLITQLGQWVLKNTCKQILAWYQQKISVPRIAINLSPTELLNDQFVTGLKQVLEEYQINGNALEFEITENMLVSDITKVETILNEIKALGISIAIDDFGTGYSSIRYLQRLPIDSLKMDKSFITNILNNPQDEAIARSIIIMGHNLKMKVVAEGVEDKATVDFLIQQKCDLIQGYYFYKPMPAEAMFELLLKT